MHRSLWLPMSTPTMDHPIQTHSFAWQDTMPFILATLSIYFCVSISLSYGFYGDSRLILGPNSSRLIKSSFLFVQHIQVTDKYHNIHLYSFNHKPQLTSQINWTTTKFLLVEPYSHKGISLWLNKGSTINLRWEAEASSLNQLEGIVIKGERRLEKLKPKEKNAIPIAIRETNINEYDVRTNLLSRGKESEYFIEEDDKYAIGVVNKNARSIIMTMNVNVSSKIYDTTKATNMCSTRNIGSCKLGLFYPITYYVILKEPKNGNDADDDDAWYVEISFMARVLSYFILLGVFMIVIFVILKCLGGDDSDNVVEAEQEPLTHIQQNPITYGTIKFHENKEKEEEESDVSSNSSEELYNEKLCIICYDEQRNCFFVPCGHCATCYDCAQRIMDGDSKVCPVCRRLIHKVRRLFNS